MEFSISQPQQRAALLYILTCFYVDLFDRCGDIRVDIDLISCCNHSVQPFLQRKRSILSLYNFYGRDHPFGGAATGTLPGTGLEKKSRTDKKREKVLFNFTKK